MLVESYLMRDIFAAVTYPQLHSLSFRKFHADILHQHLTGLFIQIRRFTFESMVCLGD